MVIVWPAFVCFVVSLAAPLLWVPLLRRWGAVDVPNARSSHMVPTIRGAGLAPLTGLVVGAVAGLTLLDRPGVVKVATVVGLAALTAGLGLVEDLRGLRVAVRAAAQILIGLTAAVSLCVLLDRSWWFALPGALVVASYVNAANFMDGVDGMSALHGLVAGAHFVAVGLVLDRPWVAVLGALTAAAFAGFGPWNLLRGRVFLGDVGSYLLGALISLTGISVLLSGDSVPLAIAPALPYLADTGFTLLHRARHGEPILESHRSHVYQRLTDRGWSHLGSALLVALAGVLCSAAAFLGRSGSWSLLAAVALVALALTAYLTAPRWPARPQRLA